MSKACCFDCEIEYGGPDWCDVVLPDDIWAQITPASHRDGGLLCFHCITERLVNRGLTDVPIKITSGPFERQHEQVEGLQSEIELLYKVMQKHHQQAVQLQGWQKRAIALLNEKWDALHDQQHWKDGRDELVLDVPAQQQEPTK